MTTQRKKKDLRKKILKKELDSFRDLNFQKQKTVLNKIQSKLTNNDYAIFDNLMSLLENEYFLLNCYENLCRNKGALTRGTDKRTADEMSTQRIHELKEKRKNNTFHFSPARKVMIPKPGKTVLRPLTIPNFDDRIIQEGIRVILNSIYEPQFNKIKWSFGFREGIGTSQTIENILNTGRNMKYAIEGDIQKAYDTVEANKFIEILNRKIKDKKFLKFIKQAFYAGILFKDIYDNTSLGIPQGGIASPILFNIYMHKFDIYILEK